ncbi:hypothetical protein M0R45_013263 [Rubus argutus]|uniref:Uncharacterized protein n=1 Tax=Rubus argutus TaxID=59490 RepID=A0AAW1XKN2_RUBAR
MAARSVLRFALRSRLASATTAAAKPAPSPFSIPKQSQNPLSHRTFRFIIRDGICGIGIGISSFTCGDVQSHVLYSLETWHGVNRQADVVLSKAVNS